MNFVVVILICASTLARPDCQESTARVVIQGPDAPNEVACALQSQAYLAQSAVEVGEQEYLKIKCSRSSIGKGTMG